MGVTQRLGTIPLAIFTDASNNVGIGGSPSGSYKFEVTGTLRTTNAISIQQNQNATSTSTFSNNDTTNVSSRQYVDIIAGNRTLSLRALNADNTFISSNGGNIQIQPNNATAMTLLSSGNVGIGTSSPFAIADINTSINGSGSSALQLGVGGTRTGQFFASSTEVRLGSVTSVPLRFFANDAEAMRITSAGNVGIGMTGSTDVRFRVQGIGTSSSNFTALLNNSAGTNLFVVRDDGLIQTGTASGSPYNNTSGAAANVVVNSAGTLERSTSSLKYKKEVRDYDKGLAEVMQMRPVYYKGKSENDGDKQYAGLIAEEINELGLEEFVVYAEDGSPDALAYQNMVSLLVKAIQELEAKVSALENKS
jgi:hypothetical protein